MKYICCFRRTSSGFLDCYHSLLLIYHYLLWIFRLLLHVSNTVPCSLWFSQTSNTPGLWSYCLYCFIWPILLFFIMQCCFCIASATDLKVNFLPSGIIYLKLFHHNWIWHGFRGSQLFNLSASRISYSDFEYSPSSIICLN